VALKRPLVIVNPAAGRGRAVRVWDRLQRLHARVDCAATERPGHARQLALAAAAHGIERVVALGGDGTVSEVADGLVGTRAALGIIAAGTGNDFSHALGLPTAADQAGQVALEGPTRWVDVGQVCIGARCSAFVNIAGCGFDAEAVRRTSAATRLGGRLPYLIGTLRTLATFKPRPTRFVLDGRPFDRRALGVAVANGSRYAGGMRIAPAARIDDGLFDICLISDITPLQLLVLLPRLYAGRHGGHRAVEFFRARELRVAPLSADAVGCQADGELVGDIPATFSVQPRGLLCVTSGT
jgi:diacylglycerol kinase (ATP)